jgi:hypothetical protein
VKLKPFALSVLMLSLGTTGLLAAHATGAPQGQPQAGYGQDRGGWDAPPPEFRDIQRQGFHEGIESARRDVHSGRATDVDQHERFRHPMVPRESWEDYRAGFRRGYETAMSHLNNVPPPPPAPVLGHDQDRGHDMGGWDAAPQEFRDIQRQGFHDGIEGARKDVDNHRRPDVNNRDEFRRPPVPRESWREYREGFRRGYETAMSHLMNR